MCNIQLQTRTPPAGQPALSTSVAGLKSLRILLCSSNPTEAAALALLSPVTAVVARRWDPDATVVPTLRPSHRLTAPPLSNSVSRFLPPACCCCSAARPADQATDRPNEGLTLLLLPLTPLHFPAADFAPAAAYSERDQSTTPIYNIG